MTYRDVYNTLTKEASLDKKALMPWARYKQLATAAKPSYKIGQAIKAIKRPIYRAGVGANRLVNRGFQAINRTPLGRIPEAFGNVKDAISKQLRFIRTGDRNGAATMLRNIRNGMQANSNIAGYLPAPKPRDYMGPVAGSKLISQTSPFDYVGRRYVAAKLPPGSYPQIVPESALIRRGTKQSRSANSMLAQNQLADRFDGDYSRVARYLEYMKHRKAIHNKRLWYR